MSVLNLAIQILAILVLFILIILLGIVTLQKKLEPNCSKDFSIFSIINLACLMISLIIGIFVNIPFVEMNNTLFYLLLCISMEIYLFHKKSKWKFSLLTTILLCFSIIIWITDIILIFILWGDIESFIISAIVDILTSTIFIIIGIVILILLRNSAKENLSVKTYTKPFSIGIVILLIIKSLFMPILTITNLITHYGDFEYDENFYLIIYGIIFIKHLLLIIGIIFIAIGTLKTMYVPLIFSKDKGKKVILPRKETRYSPPIIIYCPECGGPISPDTPFCTNCGHRLNN
ncbi:zinc ribbon domain-containing protein [Promethearchaeum syntrophicum]|uniref:Zinc ribbon domain-containing protein n=1 Tax=Promethearchaeum syntrophicum TaxID=2594042 RepID=A0A5B9DBB2_9ARCH|nr:zinc ribbon domain-containing protein [Candidatus Prometheoarchaeum syntrophicum]